MSNARVTNLGLFDRSLMGSIPKELGHLSALTRLVLSGNSLSGSIPKELGDLSSLKGLELRGNSLSGSIPKELGNLSALTNLLLHDNSLSGSIPKELGNLSLLNRLLLYDNSLSGSIPKELGNLSLLSRLRLINNSLSGCIPSAVEALRAGALAFEINPQRNNVNLPVCPGVPVLTLKPGVERIAASWTAPAGGTPTDYDLNYKLSSASDWTDASHTGTGTTATIYSLANGSEYDVRVRANTATDTGDWSETKSATPMDGVAAPVFVPAAGATVTDAGTNITLTFEEAVWKDASGGEFGNADLGGILTLKRTDENGADIGFSASIDAAKQVITVDPTADLADGAVYVAISDGHFDAAGHQGAAANATFTVDTTGPAFSSATVAGTVLRVTFDEPLGAAARLANTAFTVKKTPSGSREETVGLSTTVAPSISGAVLTLTLADAGAVTATDTDVKVSYAKPTPGSGKRLVDTVGNEVADFDDHAVSNAVAPAVAAVAVVSTPPTGQSNTYKPGDTVRARVTFNLPVDVVGDPGLELRFDRSYGTKAMTFDGTRTRTNTTTLEWTYTVVTGNLSTSGIGFLANKLTVGTGVTIRKAGTTVNADLSYAAVDYNASHKVDGLGPGLVRASPIVFSTPPQTYAIGDVIEITASFMEAATVTTVGHPVVGPQISVRVGSVIRRAVYSSGSGTSRLHFRYRVVAGDRDPDGPEILANWLQLNGGTIADAFGNESTFAQLWHEGVSSVHPVDGVRPRVSIATVAGTVLTVTFREPLGAAARLANTAFTVKKTPSGSREETVGLSTTVAPSISGAVLTLTLADAGAVTASDTDVKVSYTKPTQGSDNRLVDAAGNEAASFADHAVSNAVAPAVTAVAVVSTPPAGQSDTYVGGDAVEVRVTFDAAVTVDTDNGTPRLKLDLGGDGTTGERWADYAGDDDATTAELTFSYTVAEGDESSAGVAVVANTLEANGGTLRSAGDVDAALAHAGVAASASHKVDAAAPEVSIATVAGTVLRVTFREPLGAAARLANTAFTVKKTPSGSREEEVGLSTTVAPSIAGAVLTLTLADAGAVTATDTDVKVSYTKPTQGSDNRLVDAAGNEAASFDDQAVAHATAPSAPAAPSVTSASSTSLSVSWSAPSALGSAGSITDYDLRYYAGASPPSNQADWIEEGETGGPPDPGSDTTATITGLSANTTYQVQVRAYGDLESEWSAAGSGMTASLPPAESLVSNAGHVGTSGSDVRTAQSFTTGSRGATITEIQLRTSATGSGSISVRLRADDSGVPGDLVAAFTSPSSIAADAFNSFTAPADTTVDANTTYWVSVFEGVSSRRTLRLASSNAETGATGWTIGNGRKYRTSDTARWQDASGTLVVVVKGTLEAAAAPTVASASVNGATLTLTFDQALDTSGDAPAASAFSLAGVDNNASVTGAAFKTGEATKVELTLDPAVAHGDSGITVDYTKPAANPLQDDAGNEVESFSGQEVSNDTPVTVSVEAGSATEGSAVTFKAKLSAAVGSNVVLGWTTGDDDTEGAQQATAGTDYTAVTNGSVTITAGQTEASFTVSTTSDTDTEGDETFKVTITGTTLPAGVTIGTASAIGTIEEGAAPTASDFRKTVNEDTTLSFAAADFTGAYSDPDGHTLKSVKIVTLPDVTHGTLKSGNPLTAVSAGDSIAAAALATLTFEPVANWNGTASFTYKVIDSSDAESSAAATVSITVSDDAPSASNFTKTVNEDTTLTFAASDFTEAYSDPDGDPLKSVKIVTLPDAEHGKLKVGTADATANQVVLAASLGTLTFEPAANWNGTANFTYKVTDSDDEESAAAATVRITVSAVDDLPTASGFSKSVNEDTTLSFAAADFTGAFSDPDGHTLKSVKIVTLPDAEHGKLKVGAADASTSQVVLAASLGTLKFVPVANWNGTASFTYKVTDSSDAESSAAATVSIMVNAVDDLPTASGFGKSVNEDTTLTFAASDFTGAFSDPDGHTLKSVKIVTLPDAEHGKLKVGAADASTSQVVLAASLGTLTFVPVANWNGTASFTYKVTDSSDAESSAAATVSIMVNAVDDLPTASGFGKSVNEDTTLSFAAADFTGAYSDPDGHTLKSVKIVTLPDVTHGTLKSGNPLTAVSAGDSIAAAALATLTFEPVANWNGTASFTYTVIDSSDAESSAAATVSITVSDDAPSASNFTKTVNEDTTLTFAASDFTGAYSDPDGDPLKSVKIVTLPDAEHGKLKVGTADATANQVVLAASLGTLTFEPAANWNGTASFTYKVTDSDDEESAAAATVSITVDAVDDAPTASGFGKSVNEDTTLSFAASDFTGAYSDPDGHTLKSVKIVTLPDVTHGTLKSGNPLTAVSAGDSIAAAALATLTFEPVANWNGTASFTYKVTDSSDAESSAAATVSITVDAVDDAPTASGFDKSVNEDTTLSFAAADFTGAFSDPDGHTLKSVKIVTLPDGTHGTLKSGNPLAAVSAGDSIAVADLGTLTFEPAANWNGTASFTYKVTDSSDAESSAAATVSITVDAVDDAPTASGFDKSVNEDTTLSFAASDFTGAYSDPDGHTLKSVKIVTLPDGTHGTLKSGNPLAAVSAGDSIAAADLATLKFEPVANWNGTASFTYTVIDSSDAESSAAATVSITVSDDAPSASNFTKTVNEDTTLTFAASDFTGAFSDPDGDPLKSVKIVTLPDAEHGKLKVGTADATANQVVLAASLGTLTFEPAANWNGTASFTYKVTDSDDEESAAAATVSITVDAVDDAPTASGFGKSVNEDTTLSFAASDFTGAFSDPDGHTLKSVKIVTLPDAEHGKLKVGAADASTSQVVLAASLGTLTFVPVANWNGSASFTYKVTDSSDAESSAAATVSITVDAVDDAPTASGFDKSVNEDTTLSFAASDFTGAFSDPDGHTLKSVKIVTLPDGTHGTLKVGNPLAAVSAGDSIAVADLGTLTFEPAANWNGTASFTYKVTDSSDAESSAAATVSITVDAVDDAPTASGFDKSVNEDTTLSFAAADFTGAYSDPDGHTLKSVKIVTLPDVTHGTLKSGNPLTAVSAGDSIAAAALATLTFEPVANWNGTASFTYKVIDSSDAESSAAATVSITVSDDAPSASNFTKTVNEDTALTFAASDFTEAFSDPDGDPLKSVKIVTLPDAEHGKLKVGTADATTSQVVLAASLGTLKFVPVANWNGTANFTYKVTDSDDEESAAAATVRITVNAVDDLPTASGFSKSVNEDTTLSFAASDFTGAFSDPDGHTLKSVKIVTLPDAEHGKLKVGTADATTSQVVLAASLGTLKFEPVEDWNGTASFTYKVTDSDDEESAAAATVSITVDAVDDRPTASGFSKSVNEDTTLSFAASDFTGAYSDPDGHTLKSVKIVTLPDAEHGKLKVGTADATANQVVLAASLGTLTFEPVANWNGSASFTYKVTDSGDEESAAAATVSITVDAVDDAPTASGFDKSVNEDTTLSFAASDFTGAFSDPDGHTLKSVKIVTLPDGTHGTLKSGNPLAAVSAGDSIAAADLATLKFEPVANWNGTASFTYKVIDSDDEESAAAATVRITVNAVDDLPTASGFSKSVNEDTTLSFAAADFTGAFSDPDGHTLKSVKIVTLPDGTHGKLKVGTADASTSQVVLAASLGTLKFEPVANWNGTANFTYKVTDSSDAESSAAATVRITVSAVDDLPTASGFSKSVNEDATLTFAASDFTGAFSDPDGHTLKSVKIVTLPDGTHGKLKVGTADATTSQVVLAASLGTLKFEPVANWNGSASFTYKVTDSGDEESAAAATVSITVDAVDDAPTASGFDKSVNEDTTLSFAASDFTGAYSDPDGHTLKSVKIVTLPDGTHGTLKSGNPLAAVSAGDSIAAADLATLKFEPVANWNGTASFTYTVIDSSDDESSAAATVSITVSDDAPSASNFTKTVNEDTTLTFAASDFTEAYSDPDGDPLKSVKIVTLPDAEHGKLKVGTADATANQVVLAASLGTLTFEPAANWNGTASFTYKVTDSDDEESAAAATVRITVNAVDDLPTASGFGKSVNEDTTLSFAASDFTGAYSDPDGHTLKSVKIVTLPDGTHGTLKSGNPLTAVSAGDSIAAAALATLTFEPVANWNGTASFTYKVIDSSDAESSAAATVSITVTDDAPSASDFSKTVNEDTTLTFAASDFTEAFSDPDGDTLKSVKIVTLPDGTHGTLKVGNPLAAVSAGDSIAVADLGTLTFEPAANWNGSASFTYKVTDSDDEESAAAATVRITVSAVDDLPTASGFSKSVNEDTTLTFAAADFTGAFSDPDGHTLKSVKIVTLPDAEHGKLKVGTADATTSHVVLAANLGTISFVPVANWNGTANFTYKVTDSDDEESAAAATVSITVDAVDDAPTASGFGKSVNEDTTLSFAAADFTGAFSDPDGHTLKSVKIVTLPDAEHGKLKVGAADATTSQVVLAASLGTLKFEPAANWNGSASFTYKVTDSGDEESAAAATVSITVDAVDDAPTASGFGKSVNEDTTLSFAASDFTGAFSDPDGHTLKSVKIVTLPAGAHGKLKVGTADATTSQVVLAADLGTLKFVPVANWSGTASFTYKVTDSDDEESAAAATVSITVGAVDDRPTASGFSKSVNEDTTLSFAASDFTGAFSDPDGHTLKSVKIVTLPAGAHGKLKVGTADATTSQVVLAADLGTLKFVPVANWSGTASFTYKVTDSDDEESAAAATVSITVDAVDDAPTASGFGKSVNEDTTLTFAASDFTGAFSDPDGHTLKSVKIVTLPAGAHGKLKVGTADATTSQVVLAADLGTLKFVPVANWSGTASFTYKVTDSDDEESAAAATVSITVGALDDRPTASGFSKTVNEDTTLSFAASDFTGAFSDPDGHTLKSVKIVTLPDAEHGKLKVGTADATTSQVVLAASLGTLKFVPVANWNGTASFTYKVTDSSDAESAAAATVSITVNAVDDAPTASGFGKSVNEDTTLSFAAADFTGAFSDPDGHALKSVKIVTLPAGAHGKLKVGTADATTSQVVLAADLGTLKFVPVANWSGTASFTYKVTDSDDEESAAAATVSITVGALDDRPTASGFSKSVNEDTTLSFAAADFTGAFSDPDGHTLKSVKIVTLPAGAHGKLKVGTADATTSQVVLAASLGTLKFVPVANWNGSASFTYKVTDSSDAESAAAATVSIMVNAVDDAPTASGFSKTVNEDTTLSFAAADFTGAFSDPDGHTLKSVKIVTLPAGTHGTLKVGTADATTSQVVLAANLGTISFVPVANWNGTASFTYKVTDSSDAESAAAATVTIKVSATAAPTASDITKTVSEGTTLTFAASDFTGAFSDPDGHTLKSVRIVTLPNSAHGTLKVGTADAIAGQVVLAADLGTLTYEPAPDWNGTARFTYKVTDSDDEESAAAATVTINVGTADNAPIAYRISKTTAEDTTLPFSVSDFSGAYSDSDGDRLRSIRIVTLPHSAHGTLAVGTRPARAGQTVVAANLGTISFEPAANWHGMASFSFTVADASGRESASAATVTVIVMPVNDAPEANAGAGLTVDPGAAVTLDGSGSSDMEDDRLTFAWTQISGTEVMLQGAGTATPSFVAPHAPGALTFRLTVIDPGGLTASDTVTVTVRDAAPSFGGATVAALTLERGRPIEAVVLPAATGGNGALTYRLTSEPAGLAGLTFDATTRTLSGTPEAVGDHAFSYRADDADGNRSAADAAMLTFAVTVEAATPKRKEAVTRALAEVATRTLAGALDNIGARFADTIPATNVTVANHRLPLEAPAPTVSALAGGTPGGLEPACSAAEGCGDPFGGGVLQGRRMEVNELLPSSNFSWTLPAAAAAHPQPPRLSLWGRGDLGSFAGRPASGPSYGGRTWTAWVGADARSDEWVAGVAVSHGVTEADYRFGDAPGERGRLETALTVIHPYGRWKQADGLDLQVILGAGTGEIRHAPEGGEPEESGLSVRMAAIGARQKLPAVAGVDLAARGDASFARMQVADTPDVDQGIDGLRADTWRARLGVEASRKFAIGEGGTLAPFMEVVGRQDGGDGLTGTGLEVAGGVRYAGTRVQIEARGRLLAAHTEEGAQEHGVSLTAHLNPAADGQGMSLALTPRWGARTGSAEALWADEIPKPTPTDGAEPASLDASIGYGFATASGVITPFAEGSVRDGGSRVRLGARFKSTPSAVAVEVSGERRERIGSAPEYAVNVEVMYSY